MLSVEVMIAIATLIFTALGVLIAYKGYRIGTRGKPKGKHNRRHSKSNRTAWKLSVAFTIKVTNK